MKNVLIVCPTERDKRELSAIRAYEKYKIIFQDYDDRALERVVCQGVGWLTNLFDPEAVLKELRATCREKKIDAILSTEDYPGSLFASALAHEHPFKAPSIKSVLTCQHKYYARKAQQKLVPDATPGFALIDTKKIDCSAVSFPAFIKPVKSFFSIFANRVNDRCELEQAVALSQFPEVFLHQFNWFVRTYSSFEHNANYLLLEDLLQGEQVTITGYVQGGKAKILGVVDSIMFPNSISFKRFDYPSHLPYAVQERMGVIAQRVMEGVGFDDGLFNIEFMYNSATDTIHIIEINPRMPSQYADMFEKVDGVNLYEVGLSLALGRQPQFEKSCGLYGVAGCFVLRFFEDRAVHAVPSEQELRNAYEKFPDARIQIFATPGGLLSDECQDGKSFRYGLIHLGGADWDDLHRRFVACKKLLPFDLRETT